MNPEPNSRDLTPAQDRLTDALLAEHARLGKGSDEDLIANILLNTVNAPVDISQYTPSARSGFSMGDWAKVAAVVVGIVSLGVLVLSRLDSGDTVAKNTERQEETFHLVVKYVESTGSEKVTPQADRKMLVSAHPGSDRFMPVTVGSTAGLPSFQIADVDLTPPDTEFGRSIDKLPDVSGATSSFKLASNDTTSTKDKVIYSGDVVLSHSKFILKADSLVIDRSGNSGDVPVLKALNAKLTHRRGAYETVADAISFDPLSGELVAKGVQQLFRAGVEQPVINQASTIVFGDDEFFINEGLARPF